MVRLEMEMAVIGAVNELLMQDVQDSWYEHLSMNEDIIFEYSRMMEVRTGYAVVNGFSRGALNHFFSSCNQLFQYDPYKSAQEGKQFYRLRIEELLSPLELPEGGLRGLKQPQVTSLVGHMMDILDPSVNYPLDFLEDMRLIEVLEDERENQCAFAMGR